MSFNPFFSFHRLNPSVTFTAGITIPALALSKIVMRDRGLSEHFNKFFYTSHFFLSLLSTGIYWEGFMFRFYNLDNSGEHKLKESFCGAKST